MHLLGRTPFVVTAALNHSADPPAVRGRTTQSDEKPRNATPIQIELGLLIVLRNSEIHATVQIEVRHRTPSLLTI